MELKGTAFVHALTSLGMDKEEAEEYLDDPKALPDKYKKGLNDLVQKDKTK